MRIKKLELVGFKSFKDRTVIQFDEGITGVVGPNGCGKSNIVDALVWVMGEMSAKHLRGSSMSDVIFAGADGYAPMGVAEVSLTLENDGGPFPAKYLKHSEVMVTRRLHRDGESEYLINKEVARLRDIQEIFMDTGAGSKGFSIIEQGQIGKIITAKPEDRRTLIEEAAGITKFKVRKRESQRKLISTEQNLVRLQDILGEQKRQIDSLERQAQRAERYRGLKRELQEKEVLASSKSYLKLREEARELERALEILRQSETGSGVETAQLESTIATLRLTLVEHEKRVETLYASSSQAQTDVNRLEMEIRELGFEIEQARRNKEMTGNLLVQGRVRKETLEKEQAEVLGKLEAASARAERVGTEYQEKAAELSRIQARINEIDLQLTEQRREMLTVSQSETHLDVRLQTVQDRFNEANERLNNARQVVADLIEQFERFEKSRNQIFSRLEGERQMQLDIMRDVENFQQNFEILKEQVDTKRGEVATFKDKLNEVASRLYGLENLQANFEGFEEGVKQVMMWQRSKVEIHADGSVSETPAGLRPMAEVVEVPEQFELAMESALGQRLQLLVSKDSHEALNAIDYLKTSGKGRSSFVAKDWVSGELSSRVEEIRQASGVQGLLVDYAKVPDEVRGTVSGFFERVAIVDSLTSALNLHSSFPEFTFVTADGDCLSPDGVLTGGSREAADSGLLKRRREIKVLSQEREEWAGKLALAQLSLEKLEAKVITVGKELEQSRYRHQEKELLILELKKDLERSENELRSAQTALDRQKADVSRDEAQLLKYQQEVDELSGRLTEMRERRMRLENSVRSLDQELVGARGGIAGLQAKVTELQLDAAGSRKDVESLTDQREYLARSLNEVEGQVSQMASESDRSQASLSTNQVLLEQRKVELERAIQSSQQLSAQLSEARDVMEREHGVLRENEMRLTALQHEFHQMQSKLSESTLKLEQSQMRMNYLMEQIRERYMLELDQVSGQHSDTIVDMAVLEAEVADLKGKVSRIGDVNLAAIGEFEDLRNRHAFLDQQFNDLISAKDQLKKVIDRINRICSRRFKETFEQVNERFMKVFPVLFGGGEARLILVEDPENGEMGIDIVARPPGKKLQSVNLLSGGEKALTAVSLIFSIFLVKPSPFCLLDEVDAPLDDANVFRFNDLVKEMAKRSQIIIVTHNKHTMKVNNRLYGVTMEEKGVSKMVSVALDTLEAGA